MLVKGAGASKDDRLPLSDEDVLLLNETYSDTDAEVYYLLLRETGLRVSELAGIVVGDVSLQDRSLHVQPNDIRDLQDQGITAGCTVVRRLTSSIPAAPAG